MKTLFSFVVLFFVCNKNVFAGDLKLSLSKLPEYKNTTDFKLYYTYLETDELSASVDLFIQKDGKDYRIIGDKGKTSVSGYFQLQGNDFYDNAGKYNFYATAKTSEDSINSETVSTIIDTTPPGTVSDYSKERITNASTYRLKWKNPSDSDFYKVNIYRSKDKSFTADKDTLVAEINGNANEQKTWENGTGEDNVDFYFALRAIDKAGNASDIVTDAPGNTVPGQVVGDNSDNTEIIVNNEIFEKVIQLPKEIVSEEKIQEDSRLGGGISTEAGEIQNEEIKKKKFPFIMVLGIIFVAVSGYFYIRNKKQE